MGKYSGFLCVQTSAMNRNTTLCDWKKYDVFIHLSDYFVSHVQFSKMHGMKCCK
ncbi:hypothetical protein PVAP13_3KG366827 [Panicum virgatum]|uniref:Uncharacterized protein n=1 Tax=Panicum virgatum TaxID=38727 RepID=A0A8T0V0Q0_PANVG|nr:hypothetical protein PVAP13_3KG366827 [Panicum virgatum]